MRIFHFVQTIRLNEDSDPLLNHDIGAMICPQIPSNKEAISYRDGYILEWVRIIDLPPRLRQHFVSVFLE